MTGPTLSPTLPRSRPPAAGTATPPGAPAVPLPALPPPGPRLVRWAARAAVVEVPRIRAALRGVLADWGVAPECADLLLLAGTELLSNAVRHAGGASGRLHVTVALGAGRLRLDVADADPRLPRLAPSADPGAEAEGGRGLAIAGFLADEAGGLLTAFRAATGKATGKTAGKVVRIRIPAA
ncbi:ATP-binding protein [Streptomyces sp. NPDC089919]|uniref:ATP-binding protein n=1 Tax=Streptomyces sp. NPDC089919 TaxID=3155188 RepID=UPI00342B442A